jgi:phosphoserine phosphatase SerB
MFASTSWIDSFRLQQQPRIPIRSKRGKIHRYLGQTFWRADFNALRRKGFRRTVTACFAGNAVAWRKHLTQLLLLEQARALSSEASFWKLLHESVDSVSGERDRNFGSLQRSAGNPSYDEWVVTLLASIPKTFSADGQDDEVKLDTGMVGKALCDTLDLLSSMLDVVVHRMRLLSPAALELSLQVGTLKHTATWDAIIQSFREHWRSARLEHPAIAVTFQREGPDRRYKRLAIFDLDSTLIQNESIDELAAFAGVKDAVAQITEQAMRGEMDFAEAFRQRVALLAGLEATSTISGVRARLRLTPGASRLVRALKILGTRVVIASGGFRLLAETIREQLTADVVVANELEIDAPTGKITGRATSRIVDGAVKLETLENEWKRLKIADRLPMGKLPFVMAVGDGANDLPMIRRASLGVAFNAKRVVQDAADACINTPRIDTVLYLLGLSEREIVMLCS